MLSKGKNFEEMCAYNHGDTYLFHFTFFPLQANSPSCMQCILLETKMLPLISQNNNDACLFGQRVYNYFDYQYF